MPGTTVVRKIGIVATNDGILIRPRSHGHRHPPAVDGGIRYGDGIVHSAPKPAAEGDPSFEAFGIVGLFTVSSLSFLVTITRRQQVAQLYGHPIYVVTGVAITPCSSRLDAREAVSRTCQALGKADYSIKEHRIPRDKSDGQYVDTDGDDPDNDSDLGSSSGQSEPSDDVDDAVQSSVDHSIVRWPPPPTLRRFLQPWFPSPPPSWLRDRSRDSNLGLASRPSFLVPPLSPRPPPLASISLVEVAGASNQSATTEAQLHQHQSDRSPSPLLPKLLKTLRILLASSRSFFFSYHLDITRSPTSHIQSHGTNTSTSDDMPLCFRVDENFFWNRSLLQPFLDANQFALALPLMQGFVAQASFEGLPLQSHASSLEPVSTPASNGSTSPAAPHRFLVTLISRRSIRRAGFRYLRRGVDEFGHTANTVETEQLLVSTGQATTWSPSPPDPSTRTRVYSFVQLRGSIPLFFCQSPYSLKPVPVLQHSDEVNARACAAHFAELRAKYLNLCVVNLTEKHGIEAPLGERFESHIGRISPPIPFEWFDFHDVCRGLRFDRVSLLLDRVRPQLDAFGWTISGGEAGGSTQTGVLRTNCMDCLDRTNVCQSVFARYVLEAQLADEGFTFGVPDRGEANFGWFNALWADNGDAISKQYASTAAVKGDFTRTRKRNYRGTLNDLRLSMARLYYGMIDDYFNQAAIDFLLGNNTSLVFDEFEADMTTRDPTIAPIRIDQGAIELCRRRLIDDDNEEFFNGWVMLSPTASQSGARKAKQAEDVIEVGTRGQGVLRLTGPLEQVVLLLTRAAVYVCRFDWVLDELSSFERIGLESVESIRFGAYVTSTVSLSHMDELRNVGLVLTYRNPQERVDTQSRIKPGLASFLAAGTWGAGRKDDGCVSEILRMALKAPYVQSSEVTTASVPALGGDTVAQQPTESQLVSNICADIDRLAIAITGHKKETMIERGDIISEEEARRRTGLFRQLGHTIRKLVWAS